MEGPGEKLAISKPEQELLPGSQLGWHLRTARGSWNKRGYSCVGLSSASGPQCFQAGSPLPSHTQDTSTVFITVAAVTALSLTQIAVTHASTP